MKMKMIKTRRCLLEVAMWLLPIQGKIPPKNSIWGANRYFQAKLVRYQHLHIIELDSCIDSTQILHSDKYHQIPAEPYTVTNSSL